MFAARKVGAVGDEDLAIGLGAEGFRLAGGAEAAGEEADAGGDHFLVEDVDGVVHGGVLGEEGVVVVGVEDGDEVLGHGFWFSSGVVADNSKK